MLLDPIEKQKRGYTNRKTKVYIDGRERLVQEDWDRRVAEVMALAGNRCQYEDPKVVFSDPRCRAAADDAHHVKKRSQGRDDRVKNLVALCRFHHKLIDPRKTRFGERTK